MRRVDLARPGAPSGDRARVARLTRHLKARLEDFGPGGPQVTGVDEASGTVTARFPGQDTGGVLDRLERDWGVTVLQDGEDAVFRLAPSVRFEDLDYVEKRPRDSPREGRKGWKRPATLPRLVPLLSRPG